MRMALASPESFEKMKGIWTSNCGCKFKFKELENIEIKTRYYTNKHGYLFNNARQVKSKWSFKNETESNTKRNR
jgi:hypothetical protein